MGHDNSFTSASEAGTDARESIATAKGASTVKAAQTAGGARSERSTACSSSGLSYAAASASTRTNWWSMARQSVLSGWHDTRC